MTTTDAERRVEGNALLTEDGATSAATAATAATAEGKAATQERILVAAMQLFSERGYERSPISQIAARAGVSRAAIFWHFGNKATLFRETCRHFLVPFRASLEKRPVHVDPRARVVDQLRAYELFVAERRATLRAFVAWVFSASDEQAGWLRGELLALHAAFEKSIEGGLIELLDDPVESAQLATSLVSGLHGNMLLELGDAPGGAIRSHTLHALLERALDRAGHRSR